MKEFREVTTARELLLDIAEDEKLDDKEFRKKLIKITVVFLKILGMEKVGEEVENNFQRAV